MAPKTKAFLTPKYWPTWIGLGLLRVINTLPFRWQLRIGALLGQLIYRLAKSRRHVATVNIRLCFPELSDKEQKQLVKDVFVNNGIGLIETAMAWWSDRESFRSRVTLEGREHLDAALSEGRGVILLGAHFSTLDLGGLLFSLYYDLNTMYRPHNNALMESFIQKGRLRSIKRLIDRSDFRTLIRALKANEIVWYAPDQDFGPNNSVYAPFFGVEAATVTATSRIAKVSGSPLILLTHHRKADGWYHLVLHPPVEPYPLDDDRANATRVNQELEVGIRYDPAQYMWMHRRFKTHPEGKSYLYKSMQT
ncbi:MAG TPA: LpxL/LpxP family Kdo(2)-lipid IV(A) lauroyl/palmitoleoyl acyltransferase [Marinobacterium sp.]|nr:LpxL/LpxP family Kdo(2)-lipid IV(A) lauroyl/palmitoleoyl acyltransferase [Marinobacterium sp.]